MYALGTIVFARRLYRNIVLSEPELKGVFGRLCEPLGDYGRYVYILVYGALFLYTFYGLVTCFRSEDIPSEEEEIEMRKDK